MLLCPLAPAERAWHGWRHSRAPTGSSVVLHLTGRHQLAVLLPHLHRLVAQQLHAGGALLLRRLGELWSGAQGWQGGGRSWGRGHALARVFSRKQLGGSAHTGGRPQALQASLPLPLGGAAELVPTSPRKSASSNLRGRRAQDRERCRSIGEHKARGGVGRPRHREALWAAIPKVLA